MPVAAACSPSSCLALRPQGPWVRCARCALAVLGRVPLARANTRAVGELPVPHMLPGWESLLTARHTASIAVQCLGRAQDHFGAFCARHLCQCAPITLLHCMRPASQPCFTLANTALATPYTHHASLGREPSPSIHRRSRSSVVRVGLHSSQPACTPLAATAHLSAHWTASARQLVGCSNGIAISKQVVAACVSSNPAGVCGTGRSSVGALVRGTRCRRSQLRPSAAAAALGSA